MNSRVIKIKNWPFNKRERVKLIWIGEPFKKDNKWMFYAYFRGSTFTKKIELDWATVHFLSVDKYYTDGNLSNGETISNTEVIDINFSGIKAEYKERDWDIAGTKEKTKSKTFNFYKNGVMYTIPIIEIIRTIIAPDIFTLNRVVEMDTLENFFIYELTGKKLDIYFSSEYEEKLLSNEKINHLAWIITNPQILRMFNSIGQNLWEKRELKFDLLFDRFNIKARVHKKEKYTRILQILSLRNKRINIEEVNVFHPSLEETELSDTTKKVRQFVSKRNGDMELDSKDGSTKEPEMLDTFLISHDYEKSPIIHKKKNGRKIKRKVEDENTKTYVREDNNIRTTADVGGEELVKGIEFDNLSDIEEKGELQGFIEILRSLEKRQAVRSVTIIIDNLPKGKKFSRLKDGVTPRKYAIGKIVMVDEREISLIEVEREDKALSMLILKSKKTIKWEKIYSYLLLKLVKENGNWSSYIIEKTCKHGIDVVRAKHIKRNLIDRERQLFKKLF